MVDRGNLSVKIYSEIPTKDNEGASDCISSCDCYSSDLKPTAKCLRKNGNYKKGGKCVQRFQCRICGRFISLSRFRETPKLRRRSKVAQLPLSHFKQWEDFYTIQIASVASRLSKVSLYSELEIITGQKQKTLAPKICKGLPFSNYKLCMKSLSYLEELVIPSICNKEEEIIERLRLGRLKQKIVESSYEEFFDEAMPSVATLMGKNFKNQHPFFVEMMLFHGVFGEIENRIQVDKTGLFPKRVTPLMNRNYFEEYFYGE